jgi:hypothetical protein
VLGEESPEEMTTLMAEDYTEISQIVDLTNWDFVLATMDTIGRETGEAVAPPAWAPDPDELFRFSFDVPGVVTPNLIVPPGEVNGFSLESEGPVSYPQEGYSGASSFCRGIPLGTVVPCHLRGVHSPPVALPLSVLPAYTLQMWVNLDVDAYPESSGIDFLNTLAFLSTDGLHYYGILFSVYGTWGPGAHQWYPYLTHFDGLSSSGAGMDLLMTWDTNQGWQMLSLTYDSALPVMDRVKLYLNDTLLGSPGFGISVSPAIPEANADTLRYGEPWGQYDACRLLGRALSDVEVAESYVQATTPGVPVGTKWVQRILIDDEVYAERTIMTGEERRWWDFVAPVRRLDGTHKVAFRLMLLEE